MANGGQERRGTRCAGALVTLVIVTSPLLLFDHQDSHTPLQFRRWKQPVVATPLKGATSHGLPFVIYHAFCAERDGCATATVVAQMEGACDARREILERAGIDDWNEWRANFSKETPTCANCIASKTATKIKRAFKAAMKSSIASRLGSTSLATYCAFLSDNERSPPTPATILQNQPWLNAQSTLVFTCTVPPAFRKKRNLRISVGLNASSAATGEGAYPGFELIVQPNVTGTIGACAWVKGGVYSDRAGHGQALPAARVAEWLAHHYHLGVDHFFIMDNSRDVYAKALKEEDWMTSSPLWPALEPFARRGKGTLAPWPSLIDDETTPGCATADLEKRVQNATEASKTTQSFFGRPSQYAAQNACHRRLVAAGLSRVLHVDVDEFVIPRKRPSSPRPLDNDDDSKDRPLRALSQTLVDTRRPAVAMNCVFYAPCDGSEPGTSGGLLLDDAKCAGKIAMYRKKLIASPSALYLWVHYVRAATPGTPKVIDLSSDDAVIVHLRSGYSLTDADTARAITARLAEPAEATFFRDTIIPRFLDLPCDDAAKNASRRRDANLPDPLTNMGCDDPQSNLRSWGWCWCRDDVPARRWAPILRTQLAIIWDPTTLARLRRDAAFPPSWPGES